MSSSQRLGQRHEELQSQYDLLSDKISQLRTSLATEYESAIRFKLENQIKQAEKERHQVENEMQAIETELSEVEKSGGLISRFAQREDSTEKRVADRHLEPGHLAPPQIPNNLPHVLSTFVNREEEIRECFLKLDQWQHLAIEGIGGIGKSSLALRIAYESVEREMFEGVIWLDCKYGELSLAALIDTFARTFGYSTLLNLDAVSKKNTARELLNNKRCLFIIDNFETTQDDALEWLFDLPKGIKVIFTMRRKILHENVALVPLGGLSKQATGDLITVEAQRIQRPELADYEDVILENTYHLMKGLPLATKWVCSQLGLSGRSIENVIADLNLAKGDFFDYLFSYAYGNLSEFSRQMLQVVSIFVSPVNLDILKFIFFKTAESEIVEQNVSDLILSNFVDVVGGISFRDRLYSLHPITRSFAFSIFQSNLPFYREMESRAVEYFLKLVEDHGGDDNWAEYHHLDLWVENILHLVDLCVSEKQWDFVRRFGKRLHYFLWARGYWQQRERIGLQVIQASYGLGDPKLEVWAKTRVISEVHQQLGDYDAAEEHIDDAVRKAKEIDDEAGLAFASYQKARILRKRKQFDLARSVAMEGLSIYERIDDDYGLGYALNGLANIEYRLGNFLPAEDLYTESLRIWEKRSEPMMEAVVTRNLARLYRRKHDVSESETFYVKAIEIFEALKLKLETAESKRGLAQTKLAMEDYNNARLLLDEALDLFRQLGAIHEVKATEGIQQTVLSKITE